MKKNIYRKLKMFACYSVRGLLLQVLFVNLLFAMSPTEAQKLDQIKISVNITNVTLKEALHTIEQKSNLTFFYDSKNIPLDEKVSLNLDESTVEEVLTSLAQNLGLSFSQVDHLIIVKKVNIQKNNADNNVAGEIRGQVKGSDTKNPLPYAIIMIVGTNNGATTDIGGNYILRNIKPGKHQISISYVGYTTKVIDVTVKPDKVTETNIVLEITSVEGKEVVVTAQRIGQQNAINEQINSSSIKSVVSSDRIRENPDANMAEALGRLPGLSLIRSGGEGVGIVIRGLSPNYSTVSLNGLQLPSTSYTDRSTGISGISQYILEGAEVFKTITADMEGNSVAGAINLTLSPAPDSLHYHILAQGGYNSLNKYWGNYIFQGEISNRFLDSRAGVRFNIDAERTNRSVQTMSATYNVTSNFYHGLQYEPVYLNTASLNDVINIKDKQAATLILDWKFSPTSKILLYNLFSVSGADVSSVAKQFVPQPAGMVAYSMSQNNLGKNLLYTSLLSGDHAFNWFNIDYGFAYSQTHNYVPNQRTWQFTLSDAYADSNKTQQTLKLEPSQVISLANDNSDIASLQRIQLVQLGNNSNDMIQRDITANFNIKIPYNLSENVSGFFKTGIKYKTTNRNASFINSTQNPSVQFGSAASQSLPWVSQTGVRLNAIPFYDHINSDFLGGQYNFGWYPNFNHLNQLWDWWNNYSNNLLAQGPATVLAAVGQFQQIGFVPDFYASSVNNQDIKEKYIGTYLMSELNMGSAVTFTPGVRYEKVTDDLIGNYVYDLAQAYTLNFPKTYQTAQHNDEFFLPMVNLKIKPADWTHLMLSYTKTLSRPDYSSIVPNTFVHNTTLPYLYQAGNPDLKPEQWTSYDLQLAIYTNEIGLFSLNGFYKEAMDKIWSRSYTRIKGDPVIPGFTDNDQVTVIQTVNNKYKTYLKGIEIEWQTNFWYLPNPLNYFTLNLNYTLISTETKYPTTRTFMTYVNNAQGRPVPTINRVDSIETDKMLNQPNSIANISLGFNYKGLNAWLSYQFNGATLTNWSTQPELVGIQNSFQMWDLQIAQELPVPGLSLMFNVANINNEVQNSRLIGDP
ncbi:MAG: TonB-dependent receptor, partial [Ignavibacteriaceae bacterium]|nr:TonB-dependent receptor [Ignavibacteriaceae bacterium]